MPLQSAIAGGDIYPCRFVKLDPANAGQVLQCVAGEKPIGISAQGSRRSPYVDATGKAAIAGEPLYYHDLNEEAYLEIAGAVSPGARVKSDANGKGLSTVTNLDQYGAIAIQNGILGDFIQVKVFYGETSVA